MTHTCCARLSRLYQRLTTFAEQWPLALLQLFIRFYMARIFFESGLVKLSSPAAQIDLFRTEYHVPVLSPEAAYYLSMIGELTLPVLLLLGLGARFAAAGMLLMTLMIELSYEHYLEHDFWGMLLGLILLGGAGKLSLDAWAKKRFTV